MKVKANTGVLVPREDNPRRYVSDTEALDVPESSYYLRRIADGDLLRIEENETASDAAALPAPAATPVVQPESAKPQAETANPKSDNGVK
ncbi:DUF2635 domain-containing protein [Pantoea stewartii]|uniref:DUF2635 domain-containing protein n=1 Tax=Pantoea stewartii TaxID=66269 RepID=UPI003366F2FC